MPHQVSTTPVQKTLLILFGLFLAFLSLELGLQIFSPIYQKITPHHSPAPVLSSYPSEEIRILCLGESTTAWGGESSWPSQLEQLLHKKYGKKKVKVINAGVPGTSTKEILSTLPEKLKLFRPHIAVAMMGVNDFWANEDYLPENPTWFSQLKFPSLKVVRLFKILLVNWRAKPKAAPLVRPSPPLPEHLSSAPQMARAFIEQDQPEKAKKLLNEFAHALQTPQAYFLGGLIFEENSLHKGKNQKFLNWAKEFYLKAVELSPHPEGNSGAALHLAILYESEKNWKEAEKFYHLALQSGTWDHTPRAHYYVAQFYRKRGNIPLALAHFKQASLIRGQEMEVYWNWKSFQALINLHLESNNWSKARVYLQKAIQAYPNNPVLVHHLANFEKLPQKARGIQDEEFEFGTKNLYKVPAIARNYLSWVKILESHGITPVAMQYPNRPVKELEELFHDQKNVTVVSNWENFQAALAKSPYTDIFTDRFAGDFGHSTPRGNSLIAQKLLEVMEAKELLRLQVLRSTVQN